MIVVVGGVTGSGKTTVGKLLAERLSVPFVDGDAFHPPSNLAKLAAGIPLTDVDRGPWLQAIADYLLRLPSTAHADSSSARLAAGACTGCVARGGDCDNNGDGNGPARSAVVACSALKKRYRDFLREKLAAANETPIFVFLSGDPVVLQDRIVRRASEEGHFVSKDILPSQFQALEMPDVASEPSTIIVDVATHSAADVASSAFQQIDSMK